MPQPIRLSDHCLIHEAEADGTMPWTRPPRLTPRLLMALPLLLLDRKGHFTGFQSFPEGGQRLADGENVAFN